MFNFFKKTNKANPPAGKQNIKSIILKISGMHCTSCSLNIDGELEDLDGVVSASTSYAKSATKIEYNPEKISEAQLKKTIEKLGYSVTA